MLVIFSTEISAKRQRFLSFSGGWIYLYDVDTIGYISVLGHFKIISNKCPNKEITFHRGLGTSTKCRVFSKTKDIFNKDQAQFVFFLPF